MNPGITILPRASISLTPWARMFGPTSRIFLPSISTSALGKSPIAGSIDITAPSRMT
jgi:hypothetical protein